MGNRGNSTKYTIEKINKKRRPDCYLTAISFAEPRRNKRGAYIKMITCLCVCKKEHNVLLSNLILGCSKSCGCMRGKLRGWQQTKYPQNVYIHRAYFSMRARCYDPRDSGYKYYGARGVKVCDQWLNDYESFFMWAISNGWERGLQLDKDIRGDGMLYSPETCSWVTAAKNMNNRRNSIKFDLDGTLLTLSELATMSGKGRKMLEHRIVKLGWDARKAISTPSRNKNTLIRTS